MKVVILIGIYGIFVPEELHKIQVEYNIDRINNL
jgi:hypothetical protein